MSDYATLQRNTAAAVAEEKHMPMSGESLLVVLLVGLIAGWLAGHFVRGTGYGLIADIAIGIVGALSAVGCCPG